MPAPSPTPQVVEGTVNLAAFFDITVVPVQINRQGTLSSRVDWTNAANDIDSGLLRGTCSVAQIVAEATGCREEDGLAFEDSLNKPSEFTAPVTPGDHTLVLFNYGDFPDTVSYRLEVN